MGIFYVVLFFGCEKNCKCRFFKLRYGFRVEVVGEVDSRAGVGEVYG